MRIEPEEVLKQHRIATQLRIEDPKTADAGEATAGATSQNKSASTEAGSAKEKEKLESKVISKRPGVEEKSRPVIDDEEKRNPYHEASCGTVALYDREGEVLWVQILYLHENTGVFGTAAYSR